MRLGLFQIDCVWEDKEANLKKLEASKDKIKAKSLDVLILPEMFATGFSMNTQLTREDLNGPTISFLKQFASANGIWVIAGVVLEGGQEKGRNSALIVDRSGCIRDIYIKRKLFSYQAEHLYHEPGLREVIFELEGVRISPFICYELRFPELFRKVANDVELIVVIASWPESRQEHWEVLLRARAIENQCFVAGVNRVGEGGGQRFRGGSCVYDPLGNCRAKLEEKEGIIVCDFDPMEVKEVREKYPFLPKPLGHAHFEQGLG